jgi:hypothetical protein
LTIPPSEDTFLLLAEAVLPLSLKAIPRGDSVSSLHTSSAPRAKTENRKRVRALLGRSLEHRLLAYTTAAGAGLLSFGPPANAEIVYTPSNIPLALPTSNQAALTPLDLNNDGKPDFTFSLIYSATALSSVFRSDRALIVGADQTGNGILGAAGVNGFAPTAAAVPAGKKIGAQKDFASNGAVMAIEAYFGRDSIRDSGSWRYVQTAYLGLKFLIDGQVHYGWARIKFPAPGDYELPSIYGYAYESTPNTPIVAGQTSGTAANATGAQGSLGALAAGAAGKQNQ